MASHGVSEIDVISHRENTVIEARVKQENFMHQGKRLFYAWPFF